MSQILLVFFAAPTGAPAAAPEAAYGLFNPQRTRGALAASLAFEVILDARRAAFDLLGGLRGAPALRRLKSKPLWGCGCAQRFADRTNICACGSGTTRSTSTSNLQRKRALA